MLQKFRDALACLLLGLLIISVFEARSWIQRQPDLIMETLGNLDDMTRTASVTASTASPIILKTLLHADKAVGETANAAQHVAQTSRDIQKEQLAVSIESLNTIGKTQKLIDTLSTQIDSVGEQARFTLSSIETTSKSGKVALDDLDRVVNDPNLFATLGEIHGAATEFHGTMSEVHGTSEDFHAYIHRLTAPVGFWKSFAKHALGFGEKVGANAITP